MREFFKGWKRKVGVVALVLACVFIAGWVKSQISSDQVTIQFNNSVHVLRSTDSRFEWIHHEGTLPTDPPITWQSWKAGLPLGHPELYMEFDWRYQWGGFDFAKGKIQGRYPQEFGIVSMSSYRRLFHAALRLPDSEQTATVETQISLTSRNRLRNSLNTKTEHYPTQTRFASSSAIKYKSALM